MVKTKEILELSVPERILMVEAIWDSILADTETEANLVPMSDDQKTEILNRLQDYRSGKSKTYTWDEVKAYAKSKA